MVPFGFAPKGWALCNGQLLSIAQNTALFSILGTTYGGDGRTTFALPDLRGRVPLHFGEGFSLGDKGGQEAQTLLASELPAHAHPVFGLTADAHLKTPANALPAFANQEAYTKVANPVAPLNNQSVSPAGGGQPHENMQPFLTISFAIALQGIFPSRN